MIYLSFSKPFGRAGDNPLPLHFFEHLKSWSDWILKNEPYEMCDLDPVWTLEPLHMPVYKMKVLTSTVMFAFGYPIFKIDIARKIPEKKS